MIVFMILKGCPAVDLNAMDMAGLGQGSPELSRAGLGLMASLHGREDSLARAH
jgi:hypothetical protein